MNLNMSNMLYDFLNALVRIILPAAGSMYFALAEIWGLPYATQIVGTIAVITTFFGLVIMLARKGWQVDDELLVDTGDPDGIAFGFKDDPRLIENLEDGQMVSLKVTKVHSEPEPLPEEDQGDDPDVGPRRGSF